jgi:hypothetical protein
MKQNRTVQNLSQSTVDNINNVRCEASKNFRNKMKAYLKAKIEESETFSKIKNIKDLYRGINDFKKGYQPRTNIVKDEKSGWLQTPIMFWLGGETISPSY